MASVTVGRKGSSARGGRAAGIATTAMAGVAALVLTAPHAAADGTSGWQSAFDDLLDEMHQAVARDAALPYAPPDSEDALLTTLQNTNYELLINGVSRVTELFDGWFFQSPETVAGDAADPRQYFDFFTPDIYYHTTAGLAPGATYELTGTLGGGTEDFSVSTEKITAGTADTQDSLQLSDDLHVNPDGTFTVVIGPDEPAGAENYMDDTAATAGGDASLLIRDMLGNWADGPANIKLNCISDCPPLFSIPESGFFPGDEMSSAAAGSVTEMADTKIDSVDSVLNTLFSAFAEIIGPFNDRAIAEGETAGIKEPVNTMSPLSSENDFGAGLESAEVSAGNFDLDADEALVVKVPDVDAAFSGIELMNVFGAALPYTLAQTTLNNTQAFHDPDGYTYYVVGETNPHVANWLDSSGVDTGEIFARFEGVADTDAADGLEVSTQVVPVDDVADYLPDDTPTVDPAEYAADMAERVWSYDYALDSSREHAQPDWVIQQLLLHGLQGLVGSDNFEDAFGSQPETPIELRFTPALSPDWDTVGHDIVANPSDSLAALVNSLPIAASDILLPVELAIAQPVVSLLTGGQPLDSYLDDVFSDPNTSITAGLLNARDDLATAVFNANDDFPSELGKLGTWQWEHMSELAQPDSGTDVADLAAQLSPADLLGG